MVTQNVRQRTAQLALSALALLAPIDAVQAQVCTAQLPDPTATFSQTASNKKFRLIEQACPSVAAPVNAQPAADQPRLFANRESVTIQMQAPEQATSRAPIVARPALTATGTAPVTRLPGRPRRRPSKGEVRVLTLAQPMIDIARDNGLDPLLLHAIAHVESRHNPKAVSHAGARGVMQVMPATGARFGARAAKSLFNPNTNLRASAAYLRTLMLRYHDDLRLVLAAYNAGEGAVDRAGGNIPPYRETRDYVKKVTAAYRRLKREFKLTNAGRLQAVGPARRR